MSKSTENLVLGLDYGTDSLRGLVIDSRDGRELASAVQYYPRWAAGKFCDPAANVFRQHPQDYLDVLQAVMGDLSRELGHETLSKIAGIGIDTTGSTPIAVDEKGEALALKPKFADNPNAMFVLWKDHSAAKEADQINDLAHGGGEVDYTAFSGGIYSSEWFWSKILHVIREDKKIRDSAHSFLEHCDWLPALLSGRRQVADISRSRCAAGHKALWHESWEGLPPASFFSKLDPALGALSQRMFRRTQTSDQVAGQLDAEWAAKLGLRTGVPIAVGAFDAHMGAVGGGIRPGVMVKIMGTSTCDMLVADAASIGKRTIAGICGQVDGSILPGRVGLEAGQSAFGDVYAWFKNMLVEPGRALLGEKVAKDYGDRLIAHLASEAAKLSPSQGGVVALDWVNGRRTPDANSYLKSAMTGLAMGSSATHIFKALVESTAFGSLKILERFEREGVKVEEIIALGGVAGKSDYVMQVCADVMRRPIGVVGSEQCCALGAGIFAAVAAGLYSDVLTAQKQMASKVVKSYKPNRGRSEAYAMLYQEYGKLGDYVESRVSR